MILILLNATIKILINTQITKSKYAEIIPFISVRIEGTIYRAMNKHTRTLTGKQHAQI